MAPIEHTKTSTKTAPLSNATQPTHTAIPNMALAFADQSSSRLMTLPREIRNSIYEYVFCDNVDYVREPIRYEWRKRTVVAHAPAKIHLNRTSPPSKQAIMACRGLYCEMKEMCLVAYRTYWSENHFVFDAGQLVSAPEVPVDKDMEHIQHFCLLFPGLQDHYVEIVFEGGKWDCWILPANANGEIFECWHFGQLRLAVVHSMASMKPMPTTWSSFDPRGGRGLTHDVLRNLTSTDEVIMAVQFLQESRRTHARLVAEAHQALSSFQGSLRRSLGNTTT